jgi:hypothetical protein
MSDIGAKYEALALLLGWERYVGVNNGKEGSYVDIWWRYTKSGEYASEEVMPVGVRGGTMYSRQCIYVEHPLIAVRHDTREKP